MNDYSDIIALPHHTSLKRRRMSMSGRAAQFSAFAALTGFDERISESGRLTDARPELTEDALCALNAAVLRLTVQQAERPLIAVTWFQADSRKRGGVCRTVSGHFRFLDFAEMRLKTAEGASVPLADILQIRFLTEPDGSPEADTSQ